MAKVRNVLERKKAHARRRFDERYGICLNDDLSKALIKQIQTASNAEYVCHISNRATVWRVNVPASSMKGAKADKMIPVVYDKDRKILVTALPERCKELKDLDLLEIERDLEA